MLGDVYVRQKAFLALLLMTILSFLFFSLVQSLAVLTDQGTLGLLTIAEVILAVGASWSRAPLSLSPSISSEPDAGPVQVTWRQAALLPVFCSLVLVLLFYFFEKFEFVYILANVTLAGWCLDLLLGPIVNAVLPVLLLKQLVRLPFGRRLPLPALLSGLATAVLVVCWVMTSHWALLNLLGTSLSVFMLTAVRLPSVKLACVLFAGLLAYDVFWVFISPSVFSTNVMVVSSQIGGGGGGRRGTPKQNKQ
jgi:hypothetical protein